jgi:predicted small secreted protein
MMTNIKFLPLILITLTMAFLASCETMDGAGRDIEKAGESVQDAAQ